MCATCYIIPRVGEAHLGTTSSLTRLISVKGAQLGILGPDTGSWKVSLLGGERILADGQAVPSAATGPGLSTNHHSLRKAFKTNHDAGCSHLEPEKLDFFFQRCHLHQNHDQAGILSSCNESIRIGPVKSTSWGDLTGMLNASGPANVPVSLTKNDISG